MSNVKGGFPFSEKCRAIDFFCDRFLFKYVQSRTFVPLECSYFKRKRSQKVGRATFSALNGNPPLHVVTGVTWSSFQSFISTHYHTYVQVQPYFIKIALFLDLGNNVQPVQRNKYSILSSSNSSRKLEQRSMSSCLVFVPTKDGIIPSLNVSRT